MLAAILYSHYCAVTNINTLYGCYSCPWNNCYEKNCSFNTNTGEIAITGSHFLLRHTEILYILLRMMNLISYSYFPNPCLSI